MSYERIERLLGRAKGFFEGVHFHIDRRNYDIAVFNMEQALQLYLKAVLLKLTGLYPEVHGIRLLLSYVYKYTGDDRIAEFVKKYRIELSDVERAYTEAKYGITSYSQEDADRLLEVVIDCIRLVSEITTMPNIAEE